jgi:DNA-binding CsgD family transcriptional regulator
MRLTSRERDVLMCVAAGMSNKVIARELKISVETTKSHMRSILMKFDAANRTHAVAIALRLGLLTIF